jgi:hypothetical protein
VKPAEEPPIRLSAPERHDPLTLLVELMEDRTVKAVMVALEGAGLVRFDYMNQIYKVGRDCTRERFARELARALIAA